ncbi:MAG: DUF2306 domain-containing protein [Pseudomonadota bacterium]
MPITRTNNMAQNTVWVICTLLCVGVALASSRYLFGVGPVPEIIAGNSFQHPWLLLHIGCAVTALVIGPLQFWTRLRQRQLTLHRWLGRTYVTTCLVGGLSGLVLALGTSAGIVATLGFGVLAIVWITSTFAAWRFAVQRKFVRHRAWMIRSFALTFAAVTLRLYLPLAALLPISFVVGYQAISFLCWIPNLLIAEFYIRATKI